MVKELNAEEWDSYLKNADKPVVVDFWHQQCIWCRRLAPIYEQLEKEYPSAIFAKLDILANEENNGVGQRYGIMGTPTIKVFCNGREGGEIVGFMEKQQLKAELDGILSRSDTCLKQSTPIAKK